jgi:hypothetical protein
MKKSEIEAKMKLNKISDVPLSVDDMLDDMVRYRLTTCLTTSAVTGTSLVNDTPDHRLGLGLLNFSGEFSVRLWVVSWVRRLQIGVRRWVRWDLWWIFGWIWWIFGSFSLVDFRFIFGGDIIRHWFMSCLGAWAVSRIWWIFGGIFQ